LAQKHSQEASPGDLGSFGVEARVWLGINQTQHAETLHHLTEARVANASSQDCLGRWDAVDVAVEGRVAIGVSFQVEAVQEVQGGDRVHQGSTCWDLKNDKIINFLSDIFNLIAMKFKSTGRGALPSSQLLSFADLTRSGVSILAHCLFSFYFPFNMMFFHFETCFSQYIFASQHLTHLFNLTIQKSYHELLSLSV